MPVTASATKAHRQSLKRQARNRHLTALYRESAKKFERAIEMPSVVEATELLKDLYSRLDVLEKNNLLHRNNVARKKSKAAQTLKALALNSAPKSAEKKAPAKKAAAKKTPSSKK